MKNEKFFRFFLFFLFFLIIFKNSASAQSTYVLPYPSDMPGSIYYNLNLVKEAIMKYWYFGDFGQFDYYLRMSDKYLVEAKTLFEYRQFLLGLNALKKSDNYFAGIMPVLKKAKVNGKSIKEKENILRQASLKHIETLMKIQEDSPTTFEWKPERALSTKLEIRRAILKSLSIRQLNP